MALSDVLRTRGQTRRLTLCGTGDAVVRCRDFSREALADWRWIPAADEEWQSAVDDVLLLVSEVVTNACLHAGGPREFVLNCTVDRLRFEVADHSPRHPEPRPSTVTAPGGHGLILLRRLAGAWGSVAGERGKTVWVEVAVPPRLRELWH
ncbi:ATP-binding protein [Streptomyces hypolithicus]